MAPVNWSRVTLATMLAAATLRSDRVITAVSSLADRGAVDPTAPHPGLARAELVVVLPFFMAPILPSVWVAYYAAIALALVALFGLGLYLGRLSKRNLFLSGLRTAFAGVVCMGLSYLLERLAG